MRRYKNSKTPNFPDPGVRRTERRKTVNKYVAKRIFGENFPAFGASLGTSFVPATGVISKINRAIAVL